MDATSVSRVRVHVAFTPAEAASAPIGVVVDVLRATSTIAQALASGWPRVLCAPGVDEARAIRDQLGEGLLGGERDAQRVEGFDVGASPREFLEGGEVPLIFSTTNGTRAILTAAATCERVVLGSLLNLDAVAADARESGENVLIVCAGFQGAFAFDDAYCAGRIVQLLDGDRSDAAKAAEVIGRAYPDPYEGLTARTYGPPGLEEDIRFCARVNVLETVPRFARMVGPAAEIVLD
jgi:2-phosphosulfolactate phosphatase